ncbi:helix-turn-helix domain-containing protein [Enterocloster asparagiformis]|uniref:helix-turn-helix domain-containing protein n=1 Tax=Enterocloster asparagiformis TaxID=333367 RepID=UPI002352BFF1|nr:helix-turn-helix transcriptional regulator [Enterocloster asparagiformis]
MGNFKSVFKLLRTENGYTQDGLADMLGISRSAVSMYENGNREPDLKTLEAIADLFKVDMDYLLGRNAAAAATASPERYTAPNCDDLITVYTRSRKNLSQEEKMRLARIILSDDDEE